MKVIRTAAIVVGAAVAVATGVGAIAALATGATMAAATAATLGVSLGTLSAVGTIAGLVATVSGLAIGPPKQLAVGSPVQFKVDPQAPVPYLIGRTVNAGNIVHRVAWGPEVDDVDNPYQAFATAVSLGPIDGLDSFTVDRMPVTFDGTGATTTAAYRRDSEPYMWLKWQTGGLPEAAALSLPAPLSSIPDWDVSSKLSGLAAYLWGLRFDKKAKIYASGVPQPLPVWRGVKVYDPRLDSTYPGGSGPCRPLEEATYVYSENPWLHALTYALGRWHNGKKVFGIGMALAGIVVPSFVEAANVADANGWKAGGVITSSDDPWNVLKALGQAGGGEPIRLGGKLSCVVKAPRVSLGAVADADLVGRGSVTGTQPRRDRINGIVPRIRSEEHGWEVVPLEVVRPATYLAEDGEPRTRERDYQLVQQKDQASELAAYDIVDAREFGPIVLPLKTHFLGYKPGDCLTLNIPRLGLVDQDAIVLSRSLDPVTGVVTLELKSETPEKHDFALGRTGVAPPTPGLTPPDITDVTAPKAEDWEATGGVVQNEAGEKVPAIIILGQASNSTLDSIVFEYRKMGDSVWSMAGTEAPTTTRKEIVGLPPSTSYQVAVSYIVRGVQGARLILGPVVTGQWTILGDLDARLSNPAVQLPASFFGEVTDYSAATGQWIIRAGGTDVTEFFDYTVPPFGNLATLDVNMVGPAYAVVGGFNNELDIAELVMRASGKAGGPFEAVDPIDRTFRLTKVRAPYAVDTEPPDTPSGLGLSSQLRTDADGSQKVWLIATWAANIDEDLSHYRLMLREAGGNWQTIPVEGTHYETIVMAGVTYEARLLALDHTGNISNTYPTPPAVVSHTAAADSAAPAAISDLIATPGVRLIHLRWTNPADPDLHHVDIYENTTNNSGTATRIGSKLAEPGQPAYTPRDGLTTGVTRYYWLKAVDTSGNASDFSNVATTTTAAVGNDDVFAASLYANRLAVSSVAAENAMPTGITVGVGGVSIGDLSDWAEDPLARAAAKTTKIGAGFIAIGGSSTLSSILYGPDQTLIDGGKVAANTLAVNSAQIGLRGVDFAGVEFRANWNGSSNQTNRIAWTSGVVYFVNNSGGTSELAIPAGSATWTSGTLFLYWDQTDPNVVKTTTNLGTAKGANRVLLATYWGGTNLVVTYGRTGIDGDHITADTFHGNRMIAGTISARELATTTLISQSSQLGNSVVTTLKIGPDTVVVPSFTEFGDVSLPAGGSVDGAIQTLGETGTVTVGDTTYGTALVQVFGEMDGNADFDAGARIYLDTSSNGGGYVNRKTVRAGVRTSDADSYSYIPFSLAFSVSGISTIQVRARAQSIRMPNSSESHVCTIRNLGIVIMGGKR